MLAKRNLLEIVTIVSSSISIIGIFANYVTDISPITGFWFISYIAIVIILSISFSFNCIQWLLQLNKPLKYDVEGIVATYPFLWFLKNVWPQVPEVANAGESKEYDTNELSVITTVLERKLVSSWYVPYISQEIGFPFACKQMLDQMISKAFKICDKIDSQEIFVDICAVLTSHLKEYRKALKRHEKQPNESIESLYKKSHPVSITYEKTKKQTSADHCTNILRILMKELVPWELWDTPHSELLVRILAKKLDTFIETELSDPAWLNDKLLILLNDVEKQNNDAAEDQKNENAKEEPQKVPEVQLETPKKPSLNTTPPPPETTPPPPAPVKSSTPEDVKADVKIVQDNTLQAADDKPVAVMRQKRGRQGRNEVKIYDRIIEGSVKTWETDIDLQCISVGQDLLAGLDDIPLSRLWGHEDTDHSPNVRNVSPQPLWFGEEDAIDLVDLEPQREMKKESSPKPADALLKDIQSTVHQAKTKIGDLQDEAAGMMEGLLDKGIAGLKKGLRFTGLSDEPQEKCPSLARDRRPERVSPELARARRPAADPDRAINIPAREENGNGIHLLVKQHRVTSQDAVAGAGPAGAAGVQGAVPPLVGDTAESPEPEYEEAADLSTSIAKLRSLLQEAAPSREEVWWEGAEETRGRTLRHASSRPLDPAALADEYDMNSERSTSPGQTTNNMQRLDRLFQRTVTGVFNSLKTAVGGEEGEGGAAPAPRRDWTYVCSAADLSVGAAVSRLVSARAALSHVDAALDSLQMTPPAPPPPPAPHPEDLEEWCAVAGARWAALGELLVAGGQLHSHLAYRAATLLAGEAVETLVRGWLRAAAGWLRAQLFLYFQQHGDAPPASRPLPPYDIDATARLIAQRIPIPECVCDCAAGARLALSSVSQAGVARDVLYRLLDVLAAHYRRSAGRHASLDAA